MFLATVCLVSACNDKGDGKTLEKYTKQTSDCLAAGRDPLSCHQESYNACIEDPVWGGDDSEGSTRCGIPSIAGPGQTIAPVPNSS